MCQLYNACHTSNKKCENGNIPPWNVKGYIKCNATYLLPISLLRSLLLSEKEPSAVTLYLSLMNGIMLNALLYRLERDDLWTLTLWGRSIEYHVVWKALLFHVLPAGNVVFVISVPRVVVLVIVIAFQRLTRMKHWGRLHGVSFIRQRKQISRFYLPQPITRSK